MTIAEARLHLGFLIEELFTATDQHEELAALGIGISSMEPDEGEAVWKVQLRRPAGRAIEFCIRPITTEGWGADFEVLDSKAASALAPGYVSYLYSYLTWVFEQALESEILSNESSDEEFQWKTNAE